LLAAWLAGADPLTALQAGVLAGTAAAARIGARPGSTQQPA
jgi:sugar/nucleoside kinase (ribokinase family)